MAESSGFSSALQSFREKLSPDDLHQLRKVVTLADLGLAIKDIEREQAKKRSLRDLSKIRPFLKVLEEYSKVIEVFVNVKPDLLTFIWGPIKLCLQIASNHEKAFDTLLDAYSKIADSIPIISAIDDLFKSHQSVRLVLADVYKDILTFHERTISFFRKKGWQIALMTTCGISEDLFRDIVRNLERSKRLLHTSADIAHFHEAQEARASIQEEFRRHQTMLERQKKFAVLERLSPVNVMNQHHDLQRRRELVPQTTKWIFSEAVWKNWLLTYQTRNHLFWLSGIPGAGKTVLFSAIVDEIPKHIINPEESAVVFFYCKYNDPGKNTYEGIAKSLIAQLLNNNQNCINYLYDQAFESNERYAETKMDYKVLIQSMVQCYSIVYVGIDGLDECELLERKDVLFLIHSLLEPFSEAINVRVFIASRAEKDIEQSLSLSKHLELKSHHLQNDIQSFVEVEAKSLNEKFRLNSEQLEQTINTVTNQAAGMFLLARLIMDNLQDQGTRADVEEELRSDILPQGIDQAYGRILQRIQKLNSSRHQKIAKQVLELLTCSKRTLQLHEIQGALSIRLEDKTIDFKDRKYVNHLKNLCGPIVEVRNDESVELVHMTAKKFLEENHSGYITSSVADFNMSNLCVSYLTFECFQQSLSDQEMMYAVKQGKYAFQDYSFCYWLPHIQSLHARSLEPGDVHALLQRCLEFITSFSPEIAASIEQLDKQHRNFANKEQISKLLSIIQSSYDKMNVLPDSFQEDGSTPKYTLPIFRIRRLIETAVEDQSGKEFSQTLIDAYGNAPFKCSVLNCPKFHEGFPTREKRDSHLKTHIRPFKCTQDNCDYQILGFSSQHLLATHMDLAHKLSPLPYRFANIKPRSIWKSLEDAIDRNQPFTVRDLCSEVGSSSEVSNLHDKQKGLLQRAIKKGTIEAARILIELFDYEGELVIVSKKNPLYSALVQGQVEISQIILARLVHLVDMRINRRQELWKFFLRGAVISGKLEAVSMILSHYSGLRYNPGLYSNVITALRTDRVDIAHMLLETQVDQYYEEGRNFELALDAAAESGYETIVRRMLEMAQTLAMQVTYTKALKRQLDIDIDTAVTFVMTRKHEVVNAEGKTFNNALQHAAHYGHLDEVKNLLQAGAAIDNSQSSYGTALQAAVAGKEEVTVRFLIDQGASVNPEGKNARSVLSRAARVGNAAIVLLLLQKGADIAHTCQTAEQFRSRWGYCCTSTLDWTALHFAAHEKYEEVVQILLVSGADINAVTRGEDSALHLAIGGDNYYGYKIAQSFTENFEARLMSVLRLLVKHGADGKLKNDDGDTALHKIRYTLPLETSYQVLPGAIKAAQFLLKHGADIDARNNAGRTPRDIARDAGNDPDGNSILDQILQYQNTPD